MIILKAKQSPVLFLIPLITLISGLWLNNKKITSNIGHLNLIKTESQNKLFFFSLSKVKIIKPT
jgi:hypothetical protein